MANPVCATADDLRRWIAYWLDELAEPDAASLEDHLFECAACTATLEQLTTLGAGIRELYRNGRIATVVPPEFLRRMKDAGMSVREYRLAPNTSVNCTVTPEDDFVASRLEASLAGVAQLDAIIEDVDVHASQRLADIPFNASDGEVILLPAIHEIRPVEKQTLRVQFVAVETDGERTLATYTFNHRRSGA